MAPIYINGEDDFNITKTLSNMVLTIDKLIYEESKEIKIARIAREKLKASHKITNNNNLKIRQECRPQYKPNYNPNTYINSRINTNKHGRSNKF